MKHLNIILFLSLILLFPSLLSIVTANSSTEPAAEITKAEEASPHHRNEPIAACISSHELNLKLFGIDDAELFCMSLNKGQILSFIYERSDSIEISTMTPFQVSTQNAPGPVTTSSAPPPLASKNEPGKNSTGAPQPLKPNEGKTSEVDPVAIWSFMTSVLLQVFQPEFFKALKWVILAVIVYCLPFLFFDWRHQAKVRRVTSEYEMLSKLAQVIHSVKTPTATSPATISGEIEEGEGTDNNPAPVDNTARVLNEVLNDLERRYKEESQSSAFRIW